jgi:hypothetical protein
MQGVIDYLLALVAQAFYGSVTIHFRAGKVSRVTTEQDYLVDTLPAAPGQGASA